MLVIGDVMLDIIAAPQRAIEQATDTPSEIALYPGGSGANQAAWLGHLGNAVRFVGRVGRDSFEEHAAALRAHGVEPLLACDDVARTGILVTLIGAGGERSFLSDRGANKGLGPADLPDTLFARTAFIHVSGYALLCPGPRAAVRDFLAAATARGIPFSVDPGSYSLLRDVGPATFLEWTRGAAMCFANADEAALLVDSADHAEQVARLGSHYRTAILTCGAAGARAVTPGASHFSVAAPLVEAVDTSGAGDAFLAGFLDAHFRGESIESCLEAGVRAGSTAVRVFGARPRHDRTPSFESSVAFASPRAGIPFF